MLTAYIRAALHRARYELLEDDTFCGEIPQLQGVFANAPTLEGCRDELRSGLEDRLLFSLANNFPVPVIDGLDLNPTRVA